MAFSLLRGHDVRIAVAVLLLAVGTAAAQPVLDLEEELDFDRPEAWAQKYFTSISISTGFGSPGRLGPGQIEVDLEAGWVPSLSEEQRTVGFNGTKTEDLNRTDVFGRLRVTFGLPAGIAVTVGYSPPLEIDGVESNLLSAAVGGSVFTSRRARLGLRLYGQTGTIRGDFTCPADQAAAGADPIDNPFGCSEASRDELEARYLGLEISGSFPVGKRWEPYVGVAASYLDLEFQVDAAFSGVIDRTLETTSGWVPSGTVGTNFRISPRWGLAGEIFYAPLDVVRPPGTAVENDALLNARLLVRFLARRTGRDRR